MSRRSRPIKKARIEIIPMIDTIFFLLVFFMMSSLSIIPMRGIGVGLPRASAPAEPPPRPLIVTVDRNGRHFLNRDPVDPADLGAALQKRVRARPDAVIVVNVEKSRRVQTLIDVLDIVSQVRTPSGEEAAVSIATEPIDPQTGAALPPEKGSR